MLIQIPLKASIYKGTNFSSGFDGPRGDDPVDPDQYTVLIRYKNRSGTFTTTAPSEKAAINNAGYRFAVKHIDLETHKSIDHLPEYVHRSLVLKLKKKVIAAGQITIV